MKAYSLQNNTRSGSFSMRKTYMPRGEKVRVETWTHDAMGILPNGTTVEIMTVEAAREDYRMLKRERRWQPC